MNYIVIYCIIIIAIKIGYSLLSSWYLQNQLTRAYVSLSYLSFGCFFIFIIVWQKSDQMISNSDLHMLLLMDFTDTMMTEEYNKF